MPSIRHIFASAVVTCCLVAGNSASGAEAGQGWQQTMFIYLMGAAIDGEAQIGQVKVPVSLSASDVFDALEFGAMAAYRIENDTWSFTADTTFMGLGAHDTTQHGLVKGEVDLDQFTLMGTAGRRLSENLEFLFGLAYMDLSTDLRINGTVAGALDAKAKRDASWVDPTVGLQFNRPIGDTWRINLRGDVGGFGIGSDLMYQLLANVRWQATDTVGVVIGYRIISFDYEDGKDHTYQHYDLTEQGPLVGVTVSF